MMGSKNKLEIWRESSDGNWFPECNWVPKVFLIALSARWVSSDAYCNSEKHGYQWLTVFCLLLLSSIGLPCLWDKDSACYLIFPSILIVPSLLSHLEWSWMILNSNFPLVNSAACWNEDTLTGKGIKYSLKILCRLEDTWIWVSSAHIDEDFFSVFMS